MKKGLTLTLLTVAVALIGLKASAMAPTIGSVPDVVVGSETKDVSQANAFVYPDAFELSKYVTDDSSQPAQIIWSYTTTNVAKPDYLINGIQPINLSTDNPINPGAKQINKDANVKEASALNPDGKADSITVRDEQLSPLAGGTGFSGTLPDGKFVGNEKVLTLFASDGSTYSMKSLYVASLKGGADRLSTKVEIVTVDKTKFSSVYLGGSVTMTKSSTQLCLGATKYGVNYAWYQGTYGDIDLAANTVYHIRLNMSGSGLVKGAVPFWDIFIDNSATLFGADFYFLDNDGNANAVTNSPQDFHIWWCPLSVASATWNDNTNGVFTKYASIKNGRIGFRIDDVGSANDQTTELNAGITPNKDEGTICIGEMVIEKWKLSQMSVVSGGVQWAPATLVNYATTPNQPGSLTVVAVGSTLDWTGGKLKVTPNQSTWQTQAPGADSNPSLLDLVCYNQILPGDGQVHGGNATAQGPSFPVALKAGTLYQVSSEMTLSDPVNPPDYIGFSTDMANFELITENFVCSAKSGGVAAPKTAGTQMMSFFHGNFGSATTANAKKFRPVLTLWNATEFYDSSSNASAITIDKYKVQEVTFQ